MKSSLKTMGVALCAVVLSVGSSNAVMAEHSPSPSDTMKTDSLTEGQKHNFQSDDDKQQSVNDKKGSAQGAKTGFHASLPVQLVDRLSLREISLCILYLS